MVALKRSVGRPPSNWMTALSQMEIKEDRILSKEEAANYFQTTVNAFRVFCKRSHIEGEYRKEGDVVKVFYSLKALQDAARNYVVRETL